MMTLKQMAQKADSARKCDKCPFFVDGMATCKGDIVYVCTASFQDGFIKGYKKARSNGKPESK